MADELTPDTGEETPELVLDQEPAVPEPTPPPEPVAPEPEPQAPEWLRDIGAPPEPEAPAPQAAPPQQPQQPQTQPFYPPQPPTADQTLERFVQDPQGMIRQEAEKIAKQMFEQQLGPVAYNMQQIEQKTDAYQQVAADNMINGTKSVVERGYKATIGRDQSYRENEIVRNYVDGEMQRMLGDAANRAHHGDPSMLRMFHNPRFFDAFLAAAKATVGYQPNAVGPATPTGSTVEGAAPPQPQATIKLPADLELVASRMSPAEAAKLRESYQKSQDEGDFDAWE